MKIGYARVSTDDQTLDLQLDALRQGGAEAVYHEQASGKSANRLELDACLKALRPGDSLLVWRLDRLGRNLAHLLAVVTDLKARGIGSSPSRNRSPRARLQESLYFISSRRLPSSNETLSANARTPASRQPASGEG